MVFAPGGIDAPVNEYPPVQEERRNNNNEKLKIEN
jgi:hypothetical protein